MNGASRITVKQLFRNSSAFLDKLGFKVWGPLCAEVGTVESDLLDLAALVADRAPSRPALSPFL